MNQLYTELIRDTRASAEMLVKSARAIPSDLLTWTPGGKARGALDILKECAAFPQWILFAVRENRAPSNEESEKLNASLLGEVQNLEGIATLLLSESEKLCEFIKTVSEARMAESMTFPWGTYTVAGALGFHYWNNTYHLGQLNYIQLVHGDTEMHM